MTSSFDELFREHYHRVVGRLVGGGCEPGLAAECAQEAFVRAYARWPLLRHYRAPEAWVTRVARNLEIDEHRRVTRHRRILAAELGGAVDAARPSEAGDPAGGGAIDRVGDRLDLARALADLPPRQRQATELFYLDGASTDEGARRLGISGGAFRFHLTRARAALRASLAVPAEDSP